MTPDLDKRRLWWKHLRPGDPFTLIDDRHQMEDGFDCRAPHPGERFTKWFATNEAPRVFEIVVVHPRRDGTRVYECRYVGLAPTIKSPPDAGEPCPSESWPRRPTLGGGEYIAVARARGEAVSA